MQRKKQRPGILYPPAVVDGHRPLPRAVSSELVEPHALETAQVSKFRGGVKRRQQILGGLHIHSPER